MLLKLQRRSALSISRVPFETIAMNSFQFVGQLNSSIMFSPLCFLFRTPQVSPIDSSRRTIDVVYSTPGTRKCNITPADLPKCNGTLTEFACPREVSHPIKPARLQPQRDVPSVGDANRWKKNTHTQKTYTTPITEFLRAREEEEQPMLSSRMLCPGGQNKYFEAVLAHPLSLAACSLELNSPNLCQHTEQKTSKQTNKRVKCFSLCTRRLQGNFPFPHTNQTLLVRCILSTDRATAAPRWRGSHTAMCVVTSVCARNSFSHFAMFCYLCEVV